MTNSFRTFLAVVLVALTAGTLCLVAADRTPVARATPAGAYTVPVPPPKCTAAQAESGNVGGCLMSFWGYPGTRGWGEAPAPGVGPGWVWTGNTFSGSPALAAFEAANITANSERLGTLAPGYVETHVAARALFEGFLAEIQAGGYAVRHASAYSFRCTGAWSCPDGDVNDLSLHAWGLAIDMNSDTNPIRTYTSQNGLSACLTPIETDMPEWMIRTAERWGLYWGGYGWNDGCNVAGAERTSVNRDTPHFEFRGTPAHAAAIAAYNYAHDPRRVCYQAVTTTGSSIEQCTLTGRPDAGWRLPVTPGAPSGARAAVVNLTASDGASPGFLTLESCAGRPDTVPTTSALTYATGESVAALAIVPLDADGRFCVYRSSPVHSVVDVVGFLAAPSAATADRPVQWFTPATPTRLLDTRPAGPPVGAGSSAGIPGAVGDLLVNLATVADGSPGYLQAGACGAVGSAAAFSNLNYAGRTGAGPTVRSNLALVDAGATGSCVFSLAAAHVIVDALGSLDSTSGLGWAAGAPRRVLDTRECAGWCSGQPAAGSLIRLDLATGAPAAAVAITVTGTAAPGFVTVGRCAELEAQIAAAGQPATSNLNHVGGQTVTNLAIVGLDSGRMCAYTRAAAHIVIDVQAELTTDHTTGLMAVAPSRVSDTRG
jgi:hypothetical protein